MWKGQACAYDYMAGPKGRENTTHSCLKFISIMRPFLMAPQRKFQLRSALKEVLYGLSLTGLRNI